MEPFDSITRAHEKAKTYPCPCCEFKTLHGRGGFEICPVCFWEDDGQDEQDADLVRGGPNGTLSLSLARQNSRSAGASDTKYLRSVRAPLPDENPEPPRSS